ncbi:MAG: hypothetical protein PHD15_01300 [Clostridia bacterium]|nr:hypothetical protein [Clostridia bacterium]
MKKLEINKGISLIVLVITIIVIIILAGAVILSLANNNPIKKAEEAKFIHTIKEYESELSLWLAKEYSETGGALDISNVNATKNTGTYLKDENPLEIKDIITIMTAEHEEVFEINEGKLVYIGSNAEEQEWFENVSLDDGRVVPIKLACGANHSFALLNDGTVKAWGYNWLGQLGDGTTNDSLVPKTVPELTNVKEIAAGGDHSLAVLNDGTVKAWGENWSGQLGDGTTQDSYVPKQIELSETEDITAPTVVYGTNGGTNLTQASTTVTVTDVGGSVDASTLQYVWDTQNTTTPTTGWTTFTNDDTITITSVGTYYLWVRASDNAGNQVISKTDSFVIELLIVNKPVLSAGMTAKKWNGSSWVTVSDPDTDTSWYDYGTKQWANAHTADGSMWVWIPRYEYKITTPHSSTAQTIAVNFLNGTSGAATSGYIVHPAFTFGSTELTGIWIAKFEASGTTSAVDVKPNVPSLRSITIDDMFTACRNMETTNGSRYGWGTTGTGIDTHLMKNIEWGAVAYLSQSIYGKNSEVWINPNSSYITGQAGTSVSATVTLSTYAYDNTTYGVNASTTGNISGVYDISGGAWEYTAAYVNNGNASLTTYGLSLVNATSQYKDLYTVTIDDYTNNYNNASNKKGDALYETSTGWGTTSWYSVSSCMPHSAGPFVMRGGYCDDAAGAGAFNFGNQLGSAYGGVGFRPALAVSSTL